MSVTTEQDQERAAMAAHLSEARRRVEVSERRAAESDASRQRHAQLVADLRRVEARSERLERSVASQVADRERQEQLSSARTGRRRRLFRRADSAAAPDAEPEVSPAAAADRAALEEMRARDSELVDRQRRLEAEQAELVGRRPALIADPATTVEDLRTLDLRLADVGRELELTAARRSDLRPQLTAVNERAATRRRIEAAIELSELVLDVDEAVDEFLAKLSEAAASYQALTERAEMRWQDLEVLWTTLERGYGSGSTWKSRTVMLASNEILGSRDMLDQLDRQG